MLRLPFHGFQGLLASPPSESFASSFQFQFSRESDHAFHSALATQLGRPSSSARDRGGKDSCSCSWRPSPWKRSAASRSIWLSKQQQRALVGRRGLFRAKHTYGTVDTTGSARDLSISSLVLEPVERSAAETLETQLNGLRIEESTPESLARRLATRYPFDGPLTDRQKGVHSRVKKHLVDQKHLEHPEIELADSENNRVHPRKTNKENSNSNRILGGFPSDSAFYMRLQETMLYLESIGVDYSRIILLEPTIVTCEVERVRRVVHFLEYLGLRRKELGRILSMCPRLLLLTVERDLKESVNFLLDEVGLLRKDFSKVIRRCPRLLCSSVKDQLRPTLMYLRSLGYTQMGRVVSNNPTILSFSVKKKLEPRLKFLESLGLSHDEAVGMLLRFPAIFNYSEEENLRPKFQYLVQEMGGNLDDLKAFPHFFGYSLESRIRPRHQYLLERCIKLSVSTMLKMSENEFYTRFEKALPEASNDICPREISFTSGAKEHVLTSSR